MKIELIIDGREVDLDQKANIAVTHSIADIQDPESTSAGYSKSIEVPLTPRNMSIFGYTNELYSKEQFNNALHTAKYVVDGNIVMSGIAQIDKITYRYDSGNKLVGGCFHVSVIGASFEWITHAKRRLNELTSTEAVTYDMQEVYENSIRTDPSLIKFFPVDRGAFWKKDHKDEMVPRSELCLYDYHPFINVWKLLELILKGYVLKSSLRELLLRLYSSGTILPIEDSSYIEEENDFYIGRSYSISGNKFGGELPIPLNIYDSWTTEDYHNNNGVISKGSAVFGPVSVFRPKQNMLVRMETRLEYTTQVRNGSTNGKILDVITEPGECFYVDTLQQFVGSKVEQVHLSLDQCEEAKGNNRVSLYNRQDKHIYGDSNADHTYIVCLESKLTGEYWIYQKIDQRSDWPLGKIKKGRNWFVIKLSKGDKQCYFKLSVNGTRINYYLDDNNDVKSSLSDFFYFEIEDESVHFKIDNATKNNYYLRKGSAYSLYGALHCSQQFNENPYVELGLVKYALGRGNSVKPTYPNGIGVGELVDIKTIGGDSSQLDYIAALRQMFNLMFYTNPLTREVFIEPRSGFYNLEQSEMVDWRAKIDYSKEIEVEELGGDIGKSLKLAYSDGNEVVEYYNWKNNIEVGSYKVALLNKTADDTKEIINTMFAPFLLGRVDSIGMYLPQEKRKKTQDLIDDVDMSITPIIGYFDRVERRFMNKDENRYSHYPQLIFQDQWKAINLGFDDIEDLDDLDWIPTVYGLNQYYKDNISVYNVGRRISVYLKLEPQDVEAIQFPNSLKRDFRAVFLLNLDGEDVPCLLESIEDYNPASGASTKCVFISDPNIELRGDPLTVITYDDAAIGRSNKLLSYK